MTKVSCKHLNFIHSTAQCFVLFNYECIYVCVLFVCVIYLVLFVCYVVYLFCVVCVHGVLGYLFICVVLFVCLCVVLYCFILLCMYVCRFVCVFVCVFMLGVCHNLAWYRMVLDRQHC